MQPNRGDQIVVAGMKPNSLVARNSVFDRIHRGTTFIVFIDGLIVMYLFWVIASLISPQISNLILALVVFSRSQLGILTEIKQSGLTGLQRL